MPELLQSTPTTCSPSSARAVGGIARRAPARHGQMVANNRENREKCVPVIVFSLVIDSNPTSPHAAAYGANWISPQNEG